MISVVAASAVYCGLEPPSGQIKDYKIGLWRFSGKLPALRNRRKDWLAGNEDNVSLWRDLHYKDSMNSVHVSITHINIT